MWFKKVKRSATSLEYLCFCGNEDVSVTNFNIDLNIFYTQRNKFQYLLTLTFSIHNVVIRSFKLEKCVKRY